MTSPRVERIEVDMEELESILERSRKGPLAEEDHRKLKAALETLGFLTRELESKSVSLKRLRGLLFGAPTEKLQNVFPPENEKESKAAAASSGESGQEPKKKRKGHGRNGAESAIREQLAGL